jgi:hypothetical protein
MQSKENGPILSLLFLAKPARERFLRVCTLWTFCYSKSAKAHSACAEPAKSKSIKKEGKFEKITQDERLC